MAKRQVACFIAYCWYPLFGLCRGFSSCTFLLLLHNFVEVVSAGTVEFTPLPTFVSTSL